MSKYFNRHDRQEERCSISDACKFKKEMAVLSVINSSPNEWTGYCGGKRKKGKDKGKRDRGNGMSIIRGIPVVLLLFTNK